MLKLTTVSAALLIGVSPLLRLAEIGLGMELILGEESRMYPFVAKRAEGEPDTVIPSYFGSQPGASKFLPIWPSCTMVAIRAISLYPPSSGTMVSVE